MIKTRRALLAVISSVGAALLASCGGGGGSGASEGLWVGSADGGRSLTGLTLSDGRYYLMYDKANTPGTAGGLIAGTYTTTGTTFVSADAKDYNLETSFVPAASGTVGGTLAMGVALAGSMQRSNATSLAFSTSYDADFENTPRLLAVQGVYTGVVTFSSGPRAATFNVDGAGRITSVINSCNITGQMTPRAEGNVYDMSISFGPLPCVFANQTVQGAAYFRAATRELRTASAGTLTVDSFYAAYGIPGAGSPAPQGIIFIGTKP